MRGEDELRKAVEAFDWFVESGRIDRQDFQTQMNIMGVIAGIRWAAGMGGPRCPVAPTLRDIATMRQQPEAN